MAVNDVWRATLVGRQQGHSYDVSWWLGQRELIGEIGSDHDNLFDNLATVAGKWKLAHSPLYTLESMRAQKIWDASEGRIDPGPIFERSDGGSGERDFFSAQPLARWLSGYSSIRTDRGGRRGKGRYFWSCLNETEVTESAILEGEGGALETQRDVRAELVNVFLGDDRAATQWQLGVFSRHYAQLHHGASAGDVFANATGVTVHSVLTSQKSRR